MYVDIYIPNVEVPSIKKKKQEAAETEPLA
jgi:hypothetical protein